MPAMRKVQKMNMTAMRKPFPCMKPFIHALEELYIVFEKWPRQKNMDE